MKSIKELYRTGMGPSSSHTMGPNTASLNFASSYPEAHSFRVTLYGSLAATGKGHLTDKAVKAGLSPRECEIVWNPDIFLAYHPNGMLFEALNEKAEPIAAKYFYSIGGGEVVTEEDLKKSQEDEVYPHNSLDEIKAFCRQYDMLLYEYVEKFEGSDVWDYLGDIWFIMKQVIVRGLEADGRLPGILNLPRKARYFYSKVSGLPESLQSNILVSSYALACSEENASGAGIVTAPTCGSCGVLPAVLYDWRRTQNAPVKDILRALATAGLIGNLVRTNASISGAEVGCQGEVGTACAMASAALAQLMEPVSLSSVEYAAEMGIEHHLGLTCDPVAGLVQIPCIERNAMGALRAQTCAAYSIVSGGRHRISFDSVVKVMKETGLDLKTCYKETSCGGLAEELEDAMQ